MPKVASRRVKSKRKTRPKQTPKTVYGVKNWQAYTAGLKQRGSLTFWFDEKVIKAWHYEGPESGVGNMSIQI